MDTTRRNLLKSVVATGVAASVPSSFASENTPKAARSAAKNVPTPNLLIVFPDEMRAQTMQFMGEDPSLTPNLNKFAKQSAVLTENISNYPLCSPFRGTFMTGKYPISHGIVGNCNAKPEGEGDIFAGSDFGHDLKQHETTWSDVLKEQGYSLGYIGKWHMDSPHAPFVQVPGSHRKDGRHWNDWTPPEKRHGFDFWHANGTSPSHSAPYYWTNDTPREQPIQVHKWSAEHETDVAIEFLKNQGGQYRDASKPFALVVSMNPPHTPYDETPQRYLDRFSGKTSKELNTRPNVDWDKQWGKKKGPDHFKSYLAMVNGVDEQFGRLLAQLDQQGLSDNTLVVFMSDHGSCLGSHGYATKNQIVEESVRTPMLFRWPNKMKPKMDKMLFSAGDIYPSLLGLMGLSEYIPDSVEGTNYANQILGLPQEDLPTSQPYIYIPYGGAAFGRRGVRTHRYTLQIERRAGKPLKYTLWDRKNDPYQLTNIAKDNMEIVEQLIHNELIPWLEKTNDPWRPTPIPKKVIQGMI